MISCQFQTGVNVDFDKFIFVNKNGVLI